MVVTVLKTKFQKSEPKEVYYRNYEHFYEKKFKAELKLNLQGIPSKNLEYNVFENVFLCVLEKHAPIKKKIIRGNHVPYMNKILRKAIMEITQLRNKYYKTKRR